MGHSSHETRSFDGHQADCRYVFLLLLYDLVSQLEGERLFPAPTPPIRCTSDPIPAGSSVYGAAKQSQAFGTARTNHSVNFINTLSPI